MNTPLMRYSPLLLGLLVVAAQDSSNTNLTSLEPSPQAGEVESVRTTLDPQTSTVGVLSILIGFLFCFFGKRLFRIVLFVTGFVTFSFVTFLVCSRFYSQGVEPSHGFPQSTLFLIIGLLAGIAGGFLFMCLWQVGAAMVGGMLGFCIAMTILSLSSEGLIRSEVGRLIFIASFVIVGMILVSFYESDIVIIGTAFAGAYHIAMGADVFIQTGFTHTIKSFLGGSTHLAYKATAAVYGVLVSMLLVFGLGLYVQYSSQRRILVVKG
ncbi:hypothetical protein K493DRAFT_379747 [Basidiobolus meristosporus CBS 931.73]|uniref:Transmembrane protein 198 n=1 Tax=Basidiobolus meristosporus CBS 931.73 TaxID=1314790 RepID=A0A1Y1Z2M7_9FUNG|nr:hypothetical protein K493DRAFT_379747 [Basidiobolus meristosporus CBS 931.73]|eukprot:ORY04436.1 hypothetical protein K493DRAFT_379747 [Basidiobolus meristosporus CBS 931.73]